MTSKGPSPLEAQKDPISVLERYALPYYCSCLLYLLVWATYLLTNEPAYIMAVIFTFPLLGKMLPGDSYPISHSKELNKSVYQVFPLVANILFTWITIAKLFIDYPIKDYTFIQQVPLFVGLVFLVPASIDASHELIHRPERGFKLIGFLNLAVFQFTVYPIEHLYLHHKYVGTANDPITSPKNQSLYAYSLKAYWSAHKFVYQYNKLYLAICVLVNWTYLSILFFFAYREYNDFVLASWKVTYFLLLGLSGFFFLEIIEYIEHYGLIYREDVDKKQINEISSWNAEDNILYNWLVFRFQRHSDHHMNAYKVFTTLELTDSMPRFPFSFAEGSLIALIPPLWYYVMNPYVDETLQKKPIPQSHREKVRWIKDLIGLGAVGTSWILAYNAYSLRSAL